MSAPTPNQAADAPATSWPDWTCVTQPDESQPDLYRGECFRCRDTTSGVLGLVVAWAQRDHGDCVEAG